MHPDNYLPIEDYGFIGDCHSCALISRSGSIDWCCMPRIDSPSCFARLLGLDQGGFCQVRPTQAHKTTRSYIKDTLVLETIFSTKNARARMIDCFPMKKGGKHTPYRQILRIIEGMEGSMEMQFDVAPRFDYGGIKPWARRIRENHYILLGGSCGLLVSGDVCFNMKHRHHLDGVCTIQKSQRFHLSIIYYPPEELDKGLIQPPEIKELDRRLEQTIDWWQNWSDQGKLPESYAKEARRSAFVLKALTNAPTGAIVAAPTTSLPETCGGSRNWDYRFSWIRDSVFTVDSLVELGYIREADGFRRFIERCTAGSAEDLQVLFGIGGERRLHEFTIPELEGYQGAGPVRVGNAAESQVQLDVYGELLHLAWQWHDLGHSPDEDYWEFLIELVNAASTLWKKPDRGIWEIRENPRHFVHSKAMCWVALDRGIQLAKDLQRNAPIEKWEKARKEIWQSIEENGVDPVKGNFIQAYDHPVMDAALLLLPDMGFIEYDDIRMIKTTDAVADQLLDNGLLRRYPADDDTLEGKEGTFLACSFWLAKCFAYQGRLSRAHDIFKRACATSNDLGLHSEEYDTENQMMLGNFPQGLTHLSLISAAVAIAKME